MLNTVPKQIALSINVSWLDTHDEEPLKPTEQLDQAVKVDFSQLPHTINHKMLTFGGYYVSVNTKWRLTRSPLEPLPPGIPYRRKKKHKQTDILIRNLRVTIWRGNILANPYDQVILDVLGNPFDLFRPKCNAK